MLEIAPSVPRMVKINATLTVVYLDLDIIQLLKLAVRFVVGIALLVLSMDQAIAILANARNILVITFS